MIGKSPVLGVDVGEKSAKFVLLSQAGKDFVIEQFGVVELFEKGKEVQNPFKKISELLASRGVGSYRTVGGISGQSVFLRFVRLPPVAKKQMDQIVRYEAQQQVPFPIDDVRWDYQVLRSPTEDERDVLLVAVKNEIGAQLTESFSAAGLRLRLLDAAVLGIVNCLSHNQIIHPGTSSLILDIGAKTTHMIVADRGNLWVRNISIGGNHVTQGVAEALGVDWQEADDIKRRMVGQSDFGLDSQLKGKVTDAVEKVVAKLFGEVSRSLGFYRSHYPNDRVNEILLCGGGSLLSGLDQAVKKRFSLTVKRLDGLVGYKVAPTVNTTELSRNKVFLIGAVGLALRAWKSCRLQIDLLPHDVQRRQATLRRVTYLSATFLAFLLMGFTYWGYTSQLVRIQDLRTRVLAREWEDMKIKSGPVNRAHDQVEAQRSKFLGIQQELLSSQLWPAAMNALAEALPNHFWLTRIAGQKRTASMEGSSIWGSLMIEGKTSGDVDRDLPLFRDALSASPYFDSVEIISAQVHQGNVEFSLKLDILDVGLRKAGSS
jgi:type IV pilus assembly protein PilM